MTAIEIIQQIESDKKSRGIEPAHALLIEIETIAVMDKQALALEIVRAELIQLWKDKKIQVGDTINSQYIKIL